jgi:hypothetical protein
MPQRTHEVIRILIVPVLATWKKKTPIPRKIKPINRNQQIAHFEKIGRTGRKQPDGGGCICRR